MAEVSGWFESLPRVTRWITVLSAVIPLAVRLNLISPSLLVYHLPSILRHYQLWRLATPLFLTKANFNFLLSLFFRFRYSNELESVFFRDRSSQYFYYLLVTAFLLNAVNAYFGMAGLWEAFSMLIIYQWCQLNRSTPVSFYLGITFPARYLPAVMAAFDFLMDGNFVGTLCGIVVAHCWWVAREVYAVRNPRIKPLFDAPRFLSRLVDGKEPKRTGVTVFGSRAQGPIKETTPLFRGSGRRLGD